MSNLATNLVKMGATPLCGVFACVTIEYGEKALASDVVKIHDERMSIFHGSPRTLIFRYTDLVCGVLGGMSVQNLRNSGEL
jgi:hypothetical protein